MLCNLSRTLALAKLIEEVKTFSSPRVKQEGTKMRDFHWQAGFGVFCVSQPNIEGVKRYIANQEEHYGARTFQEEYRLCLQRHRIEYDQRYVWGSLFRLPWAWLQLHWFSARDSTPQCELEPEVG